MLIIDNEGNLLARYYEARQKIKVNQLVLTIKIPL